MFPNSGLGRHHILFYRFGFSVSHTGSHLREGGERAKIRNSDPKISFGLWVQVRWSDVKEGSGTVPPTAVLLHGILGGRRNWGKFYLPSLTYPFICIH